nr:hypothetical protein BaRGS_007625 [Batillaria attramentaria]
MDIIGPLQVTDRGNQYIVALTDHFTKFPVAKAIPCKSSEEVARFMYETICIFGAFDSLITDQGQKQKEYYDSRRAYDHGFRIGDKVLIINAARVHRMGGKMAPDSSGHMSFVDGDNETSWPDN